MAALVLAGCGGGSENASPAEVATSAAGHSDPARDAKDADKTTLEKQSIEDPAGACGDFSGSDAKACGLSYSICLLNAKKIVTAYYREEPGPNLDQYAARYAKDEYGASGSSQDAAYMGCLGALLDEYDARYR